MPVATPLSSVVRISGAAFCTSSLALCALSTPRSLNQPWILSSDWFELRRDVARVGGYAAEDEAEDQHADGDEPEQDEDRAADTRNPVALQPTHRGAGDRAEHRGEDHRHDDRRGLAEQPDDPDDDQHEADQQPRREAQVPEPRGSGKLNAALGRHPLGIRRRAAQTCLEDLPEKWRAPILKAEQNLP